MSNSIENDNEDVKDIVVQTDDVKPDDFIHLEHSTYPSNTLSSHPKARSRTTNPLAKKNLLFMSLGYTIALLGIKITLSFAVPLLGNLGSISMALLYFGSAIISFIIPICLTWFKDECQCIIILAFEYGIYTLIFSYIIPWLCVIFSVFHGMVAGVFWAAESIYLNANSTDENRGRNAGNFWGVYMLGSVIGNLGAFFLFKVIGTPSGTASEGWNGPTSILFLILGIISLVGTIPLFFMKKSAYETKSPKNDMTLGQRILAVSRLACTPKMLLILPMLWYVGYEYVFVSSMVTRQISDVANVGIYMAFMNVVAAISSFTVGPLADKVGYTFITLMGTLSEIVALVFVYFANISQDYLWFLAVMFFSISDSCYETVVPIVIGKYFEDQRTANSVFRLLQNIGGGVCYILAPIMKNPSERSSTQNQLLWELIICGVQAIIVYCCYVAFNGIYDHSNKLIRHASAKTKQSMSTKNNDNKTETYTASIIPPSIEGKAPSLIFSTKEMQNIQRHLTSTDMSTIPSPTFEVVVHDPDYSKQQISNEDESKNEKVYNNSEEQ